MSQKNIPFQVIDWKQIDHLYYPGEQGLALWKTLEFPGLRIRMVEYSAGYVADHWCQKGHIVHCLEGELITEQEHGGSFRLKKGMTYVVTDEMSSHRSTAEDVVRLLIIDGDFLKYEP
jgi:quercetin dioxygenase-like cupin family protein